MKFKGNFCSEVYILLILGNLFFVRSRLRTFTSHFLCLEDFPLTYPFLVLLRSSLKCYFLRRGLLWSSAEIASSGRYFIALG